MNFQASYFTPTQISELIGVSRHTVLRWIRSGKFKASPTPGGHHRVSRVHLIEFLRLHEYAIPSQWESPPKVLLANQDEALLHFLKSWLEVDVGGEFYSSASVYESLLITATQKPDLVVLDLHLSGLDAFEFCRHVRNTNETSGCRILVLADNAPFDELALQQAGADRILYKPVALPRLRSEVKNLLRRARRN